MCEKPRANAAESSRTKVRKLQDDPACAAPDAEISNSKRATPETGTKLASFANCLKNIENPRAASFSTGAASSACEELRSGSEKPGFVELATGRKDTKPTLLNPSRNTDKAAQEKLRNRSKEPVEEEAHTLPERAWLRASGVGSNSKCPSRNTVELGYARLCEGVEGPE